ncbi:hypothetical protein F4820DRAFT_452200 [Hypoxylon rubiginosum]|uniref:Uncharacterized protein n=1 Tax=Hypoxylon rubiginosum TaxID=110542 RepID=A0ACB9YPC2_9PEZI|nr:hypothetical protein F4820DRAFT_452200 [Hypoxylon rubiginosum]
MKCLVTSEGKSRLDEHLRKVVCHHGIDDSLYEEEYTITVSEGRRVFCLFTPVTMNFTRPRPFEASDAQEIEIIIGKGVFSFEKYDAAKHSDVRLFNSRVVHEVKGKATDNPYVGNLRLPGQLWNMRHATKVAGGMPESIPEM